VLTGQQYVCNLVLFHVAFWCCNLCSFLPVEAMTSTLSLSTIVVASHEHSLGFPGDIGQTWLSSRLLWQTWPSCNSWPWQSVSKDFSWLISANLFWSSRKGFNLWTSRRKAEVQPWTDNSWNSSDSWVIEDANMRLIASSCFRYPWPIRRQLWKSLYLN